MSAISPPPVGPDLKVWARQLSAFLSRSLVRLQFKTQNDTAAEDGVMLWDGVEGYPVVSKDGVWRQLVMADGYAEFVKTTTVTAAAINTPYAITMDTPLFDNGIHLGTPTSRIVFDEGGVYLLAFSAQILATSANAIEFNFWPRLDGADVPFNRITTNTKANGVTTVVSRTTSANAIEFNFWPRLDGADVPFNRITTNTKANGVTTVVSRTIAFTISAGSYIEVIWQVDDLSGQLVANPAATLPSSPSVTLSITRIRA